MRVDGAPMALSSKRRAIRLIGPNASDHGRMRPALTGARRVLHATAGVVAPIDAGPTSAKGRWTLLHELSEHPFPRALEERIRAIPERAVAKPVMRERHPGTATGGRERQLDPGRQRLRV